MDRGRFMFVVVIPPRFEHDLRAGRNPAIQVNIDATAMQQAGIGAGYIKNIINDRIAVLPQAHGRDGAASPINLVVRKLFNPNGVSSWFKSVVAIINQITLLTVVLTGAAVIREREHGTLEHLLVMPLTAFEIAMAKVWANSLVILVATGGVAVPGRADGAEGAVRRLGRAVVRRRRALPVLRDRARDLPGDDLAVDGAVRAPDHPGDRRAACCSRAAARPSRASRSGCSTLTYLLPSRHFVSFSQVIIYRGGGLGAVWRQFLMVGGDRPRRSSSTACALFRKSIAVTK